MAGRIMLDFSFKLPTPLWCILYICWKYRKSVRRGEAMPDGFVVVGRSIEFCWWSGEKRTHFFVTGGVEKGFVSITNWEVPRRVSGESSLAHSCSIVHGRKKPEWFVGFLDAHATINENSFSSVVNDGQYLGNLKKKKYRLITEASTRKRTYELLFTLPRASCSVMSVFVRGTNRKIVISTAYSISMGRLRRPRRRGATLTLPYGHGAVLPES